MDPAQPFSLFDCNLARCAVGRTCTNLRELLDVVRTASDATLEHLRFFIFVRLASIELQTFKSGSKGCFWLNSNKVMR